MDHTQNRTAHRSLAPYVEVLAEEAASGVRLNALIGRWSISEARFQHMADGINQRRNTQVTAVEVRGHYKRLEHEYRAFKELITSEGFFWDKEAYVVLATAECWDNYLETHHGAAKFRVKGCAHFSLLERMFSFELPLQPLDVVLALPVQNPIPEAN